MSVVRAGGDVGSRVRLALALALCFGSLGCVGPAYRVDGYAVPAKPPAAEPRVGVARVDITLPPGFPTGGHGPIGQLARGHWTRLYARAFFFQDASGDALVLVSCDMFAVPGGLHARVASQVTTRWSDAVALGPESIVLAATHTHQGPGNYLTSGSYNAYGSFYPGFDERILDFLTARISQAISDAIADARTPGSVKLSLYAGRFGELLNREPAAFLSNPDAPSLMDAFHGPARSCPSARRPLDPEGDWDLPGCPRLRATRPDLRVLAVERGGERIGALLFLAVHPTVLIHDAPVFQSDFTGWATSQLENAGIARVAGFFNGAEGDVVPRRARRDVRDVARLGTILLAATRASLGGAGRDLSLDVETRHRLVPMASLAPGVRLWDGLVRWAGARPEDRRPGCPARDGGREWGLSLDGEPGGAAWRLAERPRYGAAALGGGEGDRTPLHALGWSEGRRDRDATLHAPKLGAMDSQFFRALQLTDLFAAPETFPRRLPFTHARLGALSLVAAPAEVATSVGHHMRLGSGEASGAPVVVIGLANEYTGYASGPHEYALQGYMGASTAWGAQQGPFFACVTSELASAPASPRPRREAGLWFHPGPTPAESFGPAFLGHRLQSVEDGFERVLRDADGGPARGLPRFDWTEIVSGADGSASARDFERTAQRSVSIEQQRPDGSWGPRAWSIDLEEEVTPTGLEGAGSAPATATGLGGAGSAPATARWRYASGTDDDRGFNLLTLLRDASETDGRGGALERRWTALWIAGLFGASPGSGSFRFRIEPVADAADRAICSEPFGPDRDTRARPLRTCSCPADGSDPVCGPPSRLP